MKRALLERRTCMLKLLTQGVKLETIEGDFRREYGVSKKVDVVGKLDDDIVYLLRQCNEAIERVLNRNLQKDSFGEWK